MPVGDGIVKGVGGSLVYPIEQVPVEVQRRPYRTVPESILKYRTGEYGGLVFLFRCERCLGSAPVGFRRPLRQLLGRPCTPQP